MHLFLAATPVGCPVLIITHDGRRVRVNFPAVLLMSFAGIAPAVVGALDLVDDPPPEFSRKS